MIFFDFQLDTEAVVTVTVIVEPLVVAGWVADSVSTVRLVIKLIKIQFFQ